MERDLQRLARAIMEAEVARSNRDRIIREMHPRYTIRAIAEATGLSHSRIGQIIKEGGKPS
jgi:hypothetical protein